MVLTTFRKRRSFVLNTRLGWWVLAEDYRVVVVFEYNFVSRATRICGDEESLSCCARTISTLSIELLPISFLSALIFSQRSALFVFSFISA